MNPFIKAHKWFDAVYFCQQQAESYVLITVLNAAGSTPRDSGAKMVVTATSQFDTIGGGHLEYIAIEKARAALATHQEQQFVESFPLAQKLAQCCGGAVKVLFEVKVNHSHTIAVFGGGHVAQALIPIIAQLPVRIRWVENRPAEFDLHTLPSNVEGLFDDDPIAEMANLPTHAYAVILTHNHQLDYDLVEQGLKHGNLAFLGMIGSLTKAERFRLRLQNRGYTEQHIQRLVSPIGEMTINGKRPIEVAVSISAQLIGLLNKQTHQKDQTTTEAEKEQTSQCH